MRQARSHNGRGNPSRPTTVSVLANWVLAGSLLGALVALVDWRRLMLNGDFTAQVYLDRIWVSALSCGALCGLAAGLLFLVVRRLFATRWPAGLDRLLGSRLTVLALLVLLVFGYCLARIGTPVLEGRKLLGRLDQAAGAAPPPDNEGTAAAGTLPPVILLVLDTVRADHLSLYGYQRVTTPQLETFADDAVVFDSAWSGASWTIPAHATLFTGLYPHQHGVYRYIPEKGDRSGLTPAHPLGRQSTTLADLLGQAGYRTAAFCANPFLHSGTCLDQGFQLFHLSRNLNRTIPLLTEPLQKRLFGRDAFTAFRQRTMTARQVNGRALHWLEGHGRQPFFLFVNYMDAHSPYDPDPPFDRMFPGSWDAFPDWAGFASAMRNQPRPVTEREREHMISRYDGAIRSLDRELGVLFQQLRELGLYDRSLIIVTSDHGEHFGEHGLIEHSVDVYEEVLRVPLLVKYPGSARRGRVAEPANLVDILPTVLGTVGLPVPEGGAGHALGSASRDGFLLNESYDPQKVKRAVNDSGDAPVPAPRRIIRVRRSIHLGRMKFIWSSDQAHELYDLSADPAESMNLLDNNPQLADRFLPLAAEIEANRVLPRSLEEPAVLDEDLLRHLEELGYVGSVGE